MNAAPSLDRSQLVDRLSELRLNRTDGSAVLVAACTTTTTTTATILSAAPRALSRPIPPNIPLVDLMELNNMSQGSGLGRPVRTPPFDSASLSSDATSNPPLSPISEMVADGCELTTAPSGSNTRSVSAAVSDESVAGVECLRQQQAKKV
jgi:hypothetical protein